MIVFNGCKFGSHQCSFVCKTLVDCVASLHIEQLGVCVYGRQNVLLLATAYASSFYAKDDKSTVLVHDNIKATVITTVRCILKFWLIYTAPLIFVFYKILGRICCTDVARRAVCVLSTTYRNAILLAVADSQNHTLDGGLDLLTRRGISDDEYVPPPVECKVPYNSRESAPKRHPDRFICFCTVHPCAHHTDARTSMTCVAKGRIYTLHAGDAAQ